MAQTDTEITSFGLKKVTLGAPVSDFQIQDLADDGISPGDGPHQLDSGNHAFGARMALLLAKSVGVAVPDQPTFSLNPTVNAGGTAITIPTVLPNGGTLTAITPTDIRNFAVSEDGGTTWDYEGFVGAISGNDVVLTKTTGSWATGNLLVKHYSNGAPRAAGDLAAEEAIMRGTVYETCADCAVIKPVLGSDDSVQGMPIMGYIDETTGQWRANYYATVTA